MLKEFTSEVREKIAVGVVTQPEHISEQIKKLNLDYDQENFILFSLDTRNKVINTQALFKGGVNACLIDPKILFRHALLNKANSIIIAHNHPNDDCSPSNEDGLIMDRIKEGCEILHIKFLDSIIFNQEYFYSSNNESKRKR